MCLHFPGDAPYRAFSHRKAGFYSGSQHISSVEVSLSAGLLLALEAPRSTFHAELGKPVPWWIVLWISCQFIPLTLFLARETSGAQLTEAACAMTAKGCWAKSGWLGFRVAVCTSLQRRLCPMWGCVVTWSSLSARLVGRLMFHQLLLWPSGFFISLGGLERLFSIPLLPLNPVLNHV